MEQEIRKLDQLLKSVFPEANKTTRMAYISRTIKTRGMDFVELADIAKELFYGTEDDDQLLFVERLMEPA